LQRQAPLAGSGGRDHRLTDFHGSGVPLGFRSGIDTILAPSDGVDWLPHLANVAGLRVFLQPYAWITSSARSGGSGLQLSFLDELSVS
jgi:hypothetical protein